MTKHFILESFWQKGANCTSISLIKAALLTYGIGKVFRVEKRSSYMIVTLKNKRVLVLTPAQVREINTANKIKFRTTHNQVHRKAIQRIREYVELCFAVMVRNMQLYKYNGKEYTQSTAIRQLTAEGMETDHLHELLGLQRKTSKAFRLSPKHLGTLRRKTAVLLYSTAHIVVVSKGKYENFGDIMEITNEIPILKKKKARHWFELK